MGTVSFNAQPQAPAVQAMTRCKAGAFGWALNERSLATSRHPPSNVPPRDLATIKQQ